jgi:hypothetical protein
MTQGINQSEHIVQILSLRGGMNERERPWAITANQGEYIEGLDISIDGIRRKRPGVKPYWGHASQGYGVGTVRQPFHIGSARDVDDGIWALHGSGVSGGVALYVVRGNGESSQQPRSGGSPTQNWISGETLNKFEEGYFDGYPGVYIGNAFQHPTAPTAGTNLFAISIEPPGSLESQVHYSHNSAMRPAAFAWWQNRIWAAKNLHYLGETFEDGSTLRWSVLGEGLNFSGVTNSNSVRIEPGVGGDITSIIAFRDTAPSLIIGKETAICEFSPKWGSSSALIPADDDDIDTIASEIKVLNKEVGIISQETVKHIPTKRGTDVVYLASDGHIRFLSRVEQDVVAGTGIPASYNIPDIVDRINLEHAHKAIAAVHENCYYIAVPLDTNTENSHVLCYNGIDQSWTVDQYPVTSMVRVKSFGSDARNKQHLFFQYGAVTSDSSFTAAFSGYNLFRAYDTTQYIDPGGVGKPFEEQGRSVIAGTLRHKKRWAQFSSLIEAASNATGAITLSVKVDGGSYTEVATLTVPQKTANNEDLHEFRHSLEDITPGFELRYKLENSDLARLGIVYTAISSRVMNEETDNSLD